MPKRRGNTKGKKASSRLIGKDSRLDKDLDKLSHQELKELLMVNMYKMALLRAQLEAITSVLVKNKITTHEEVWKGTNENFQNTI